MRPHPLIARAGCTLQTRREAARPRSVGTTARLCSHLTAYALIAAAAWTNVRAFKVAREGHAARQPAFATGDVAAGAPGSSRARAP